VEENVYLRMEYQHHHGGMDAVMRNNNGSHMMMREALKRRKSADNRRSGSGAHDPPGLSDRWYISYDMESIRVCCANGR
jgi:hypothetical protein